MLAHPKCNVGPEQPTLKYRTETVLLHNDNGAEPIETTRIVWEGEAPGITAEDLVSRPEPVSREDRGRVVEWLEKALPSGCVGNKPTLTQRPKQLGLSWMLRTAKAGCRSRPKEDFHPAVWWWWLVPTAYQSSPTPAKWG
jgi:hypothetical protein